MLSFWFKVYDTNGDGVIDQSELQEIITSCLAENRIELCEDKVNDLATALFSAAAGKDGISLEDFSGLFRKHKGLCQNLLFSKGKN